jgi:hypothetical protein
LGKSGRRIGEWQIREDEPLASLREIINGTNGLGLRQGEKVVAPNPPQSLVWRIMRRLQPELFAFHDQDALSREEVYQFAWGCIKRGRPEPAAVAVICSEWLQRPKNGVPVF